MEKPPPSDNAPAEDLDPADRSSPFTAEDPVDEDDFSHDLNGSADDSPPDAPISTDLPCIRCEYNLRSLLPSGNCPECGCRIQKSVDFATEEQLCVACLRPNHPSAAVCGHCGAPAGAAGATAAYWRVTPVAVRSEKAREAEAVEALNAENDEPSAPSIIPSFCGILICLPIALAFAHAGWDEFHQGDDGLAGALILGLFSFIFLMLAFVPTRKYFRARGDFRYFQAKKKSASTEPPPP